MITIEHCASCEEHKYITQHQTDAVFKELALNYGRIIRERFPFIKVYLKPIDVEIVKNTIYRIPKVQSNGAAHPLLIYSFDVIFFPFQFFQLLQSF